MKNYRSFRSAVQFAVITSLALLTTACLSDSDESDPAANVAISITSPDALEIDTTDETIVVEGTASSPGAINTVSWLNELGGEGMASGTTNWQTGTIPLALGANKITITAVDAAGDSSSDTLVVNRESGTAKSATVSWEAPTERADGSALTELAGYRIYYGRMSEIYDYEIEVDNPGLMTYVVEDLAPGEWYFAVAAFDSEGLESDYSIEAYHKVL